MKVGAQLVKSQVYMSWNPNPNPNRNPNPNPNPNPAHQYKDLWWLAARETSHKQDSVYIQGGKFKNRNIDKQIFPAYLLR